MTVTGFGYWSGEDVRVEFRPAAVGTGVVFVRSDLGCRLPVDLQHRVEMPRRTSLRLGSVQIEMVEHIMAALAGLQIDNCEVHVDADEMPGCDGSSLAFVEALDRAGRRRQDAIRERLTVREPLRVSDGDSWIEIHPGSDRLRVRYRLDYGSDNAIGRQTIELDVTPDAFRHQLAAARTFIFREEAEWLRQRGLARRATPRDLLVFDDRGPIDNELRFEDECVRHKALDLIGDLALCGCDVVGHVIAHRSGHRLNAEMVRALLIEGHRIGDYLRSA